MRNLKSVAAACSVLAVICLSGSTAQAARFHVPTIPSFKVGSMRIPQMPSVSRPTRVVVTPPTIASAANFLASKKH